MTKCLIGVARWGHSSVKENKHWAVIKVEGLQVDFLHGLQLTALEGAAEMGTPYMTLEGDPNRENSTKTTHSKRQNRTKSHEKSITCTGF